MPGSSSSGGVPDERAAFLRAYVQEVCARMVRCAPQLGSPFATTESCYAHFTPGGSLDYLDQSYSLGDAASRQACLAVVASSPCTDGAPGGAGTACESVVAPRYPTAAGHGGCADGPGKGCGAGNYCDTNLITPGTPVGTHCSACLSQYADGQACSTRTQCAGGACVRVGDGGSARVCRPRTELLAAGAPCSTGGDCAGSLGCFQDGSGVARCSPWATAGERCHAFSDSAPPCVAEAECLTADGGRTMLNDPSGTCVPLLANGERCTPWVTRDCASSMCIFASPEDTSGTCGFTVSPTTVGGPCLGFFSFCSGGQYADQQQQQTPDGGVVRTCTCRAKVADCQACQDGNQCNSGICDLATSRCVGPRAVGARCSGGSDCESHVCEFSSGQGICVAPYCQ